MKRVALIIIDMQNDFVREKGFLHKLGFDLHLAQAIIPSIRRLAEVAREKGMPVVYVMLVLEPGYVDAALPLDTKFPEARQIPFVVKGTWGSQIADELIPQEGDYVITKKGYSSFHGTPLDRLLRNLGVDTLILAGVMTDTCVENAIREAVCLGYNIIEVADATGATTWERYEGSLERTRRLFGEVKNTEEVITMLELAASENM